MEVLSENDVEKLVGESGFEVRLMKLDLNCLDDDENQILGKTQDDQRIN